MRRSITSRKWLRGLLAALFWLAVWQVIQWIVAKEILLVSPFTAFRRLFELALEPAFWAVVAGSMGRICLGFLLGVLAGVLLAVAARRAAVVDLLLSPLVSVIKATPVASFVILALVWIRSGWLSVFISFLMVLPMLYASVRQGIAETDRELLEMGRVYRFSPGRMLRLIWVPSVLPYFLPTARTALGFAFKSGIAAEVLGLPRNAIGTELYNAKIYLETADLFAWTIVVIVLSVAIEKIFLWILQLASSRLHGVK